MSLIIQPTDFRPTVHLRHFHAYHYRASQPGPTRPFHKVEMFGDEIARFVPRGWQRFCHPEGLTRRLQNSFRRALIAVLMRHTSFIGRAPPLIFFTRVRRHNFIDINMEDVFDYTARQLDPIEIPMRVGNDDRVVSLFSYSRAVGLEKHHVRMFLHAPSRFPTRSMQEVGKLAVEQLDRQLHQGRVLDAWMHCTDIDFPDGTQSTWNKRITFLVALYDDVALTIPSRYPLAVLARQHGYLLLCGQDIPLEFLRRKRWCTRCKSEANIDEFHTIRTCSQGG